MAEFLFALAEFDRRRARQDLGYSSLFYFLHRELRLSKGAAHYRKTAADLVQKFPEIIEPLRDGRLCITSIVYLAKVLTPENRHDMLPKFFQRSRRESKAMAAAIRPAESVPHRDVVTASRDQPRPLSAQAVSPSAPPAHVEVAVQPAEPDALLSSHARDLNPSGATRAALATSRAQPVQRDSDDPLTGELSRLHITVSSRFLEKLQAARAATRSASHQSTLAPSSQSGVGSPDPS